jgi:hypothetical protein
MRSGAIGPAATTGGKVDLVPAAFDPRDREAAPIEALRSWPGEVRSCAKDSPLTARGDLPAFEVPLAIAARRELERLTADAYQAMGRYLTEQHPLPARVGPARSSAHAQSSSARD